jgi:hypothetical protein
LGWGRHGRRGAGAGCLQWLSDSEHGGVRSSTGAVEEEEKGGAPRCCAPFIAARGGGRWRCKLWERWAENGGNEAVGMGKVAATTVRRCSARFGRLCSERVTDRWVPCGFRFFQFIQNQLNIKNSKWVPYVTPQIPNFCMLLAREIMNNFVNCANI